MKLVRKRRDILYLYFYTAREINLLFENIDRLFSKGEQRGNLLRTNMFKGRGMDAESRLFINLVENKNILFTDANNTKITLNLTYDSLLEFVERLKKFLDEEIYDVELAKVDYLNESYVLYGFYNKKGRKNSNP